MKILADVGMNLFDVAGKTALITGGGSGLGQFMAKALAEAGVRVYLVGRREDRLSASLGDHDGAISVSYTHLTLPTILLV